MKPEDAKMVVVGTVLVSDEIGRCPMENLLSCGVDCIAINQDNCYRFRRRHPSYNGEEFFLTQSALANSHWIPVEAKPL